MPFDWKTPIGYLVAICVELLPINCVLTASICNVCSGVAPSCFMIAFAKDITEEVEALHQNSTVNSNRSEIYKKVRNILQFHSFAKQLSLVHFLVL